MAENSSDELSGYGLAEQDDDDDEDDGESDDEDEASRLFDEGYDYDVSGDYRKAAACYRKAANMGYEYAQYNLAILYKNGNGLKKNVEKAKVWFRKAADQGNEDAKRELAKIKRAERKMEKSANNESCSIDGLEELNALIGLKTVKEDIQRLVAFVSIQKQRARKGLKTIPITYHCVFTGNPGTGKTTVARIVAGIYKSLGVIKKGQCIEVARSDLIGEYLGQTAVKTNKVINSALDGVLFIDEAYSLVGENCDDYGRETITTLLKRMEDDRDRLVVILAGYGDEMRKFIDSNPGLQSRFNRYIHFSDYSAKELQLIFEQLLAKNQYRCDDGLQRALPDVFERMEASKDKNFGNGRVVRNLFEKTLSRQSERLTKQGVPSKDELQTILLSDLNV